MPATSDSQRRLMGMALSVKRGRPLSEIPAGARKAVARMQSMTEDQLRDFARKAKRKRGQVLQGR